MMNVDVNLNEDLQVESIQVNGKEMPEKNFAEAMSLIKPAKTWNTLMFITCILSIVGFQILAYALAPMGVLVSLLISLPVLAPWPISMFMVLHYSDKFERLVSDK